MAERSNLWQAIIALVISTAMLGFLTLAAWFIERSDNLFGHGPLPSGLDPRGAYVLTLLSSLFAVLAGGITLLGVRQAKYFTRRFAWLIYLVVGVPALLLLFAPITRHGSDHFAGLPEYLSGIPGHILFATALGALFIGGVDLRSLVPSRWLLSGARPGAARTPAGLVQGLPGRLTSQAWRVLSVMQEEARRFEHAYMGTEHLLLGLVREEQSVGARALANLGVDLDSLRTQVQGVIGRRGSLYTGTTGITRRCQRIIESAARSARTEGQRLVGTGHLLQSLVDQTDDAAADLLRNLNVTSDRVSAELKRLGPETE